jgi:hypothetical protein
LAFVAAPVPAADTTVCFGATLTRVGSTGAVEATGNSGYRFEVQGGSCGFATPTPFFLSTQAGQGGLAILLTALALNKPVTMVVPAPVTPNSLVFKVHVDD